MNDRIYSIIEEVKSRLKPKSTEIKLGMKLYEEIRSRLVDEFKRYGCEITLQGSFAKGTAISGDLDLDIFILVPKNLGRLWIKNNFIKITTKLLKDMNPSVRYAEHPYVRVEKYGLEADVVPALKVSSGIEAETATDRTPYHTRYILESINDDLRDEVRLLKKFMKVSNVYGAEVKVNGFSGYLVELLILKYGSFINVIRSAAHEWRIPLELYLEGYSNALEDIKNIYTDSVMFFPDPVDPKRNVAAAVSRKSLSKFIFASKMFLNDPHESYFFPEPIKIDYGRIEKIYCSRKSDCPCLVGIIISINSRESPDNVWGEIKRVSRRIYNMLSSEGYEPIRYDYYWDEYSDKGLIVVEFKDCVFRGLKLVRGPPAYSSESINFARKQLANRKGFWIDPEGRLMGYREWRYGDVVSLILDRSASIRGKNIFGIMNTVVGINNLVKVFNTESFKEWIIESILGVPKYLWRGKILNEL